MSTTLELWQAFAIIICGSCVLVGVPYLVVVILESRENQDE